jgi:hypothetical protein
LRLASRALARHAIGQALEQGQRSADAVVTTGEQFEGLVEAGRRPMHARQRDRN